MTSNPFQTSGTSPTELPYKSACPPDFSLQDHGSLVLLHPLTEDAHEWVDEHIGRENGFQPYWPTVVIEPRYVSAIVDGIRAEGLEVQS